MKISTFLQKAVSLSGKMSASEFLKKNREYICSFKSCLPVMAMLEQGKMFPTPALLQITTLLATEKDPFEKSEETVDLKTGEVKAKTPASLQKKVEKADKKVAKYIMFLYVKSDFGGESVQELTYEAKTYQEAMGLANRRLFQNESSTRMEVIGMGISTFITRDQAVSEILKQPSAPSYKKTHKGTSGGLGFKVTAKQFVAKFSRG